MKRVLFALVLILAFVQGSALADDVMENVGAKAALEAMDQLGFESGNENVLALTDAGYAMINGQTTEKAVKGVTENCGCTIGDGNLLMIQRSKFNPL